MIYVTKPFMPPIGEYEEMLKSIWERQWLTNNGPLVNELELKLKEHLDVKHLLYINNGTVALQIAIKALELKGEIITTPFSYVATTSSAVWEGLTPVYVDIDEHTFNIDVTKIEEKITPQTSAILATHVFGNPCDIEAIETIARKHNLKVIYDAAHCFNTKYKGRSVYEYGDISIASFHATKLFHTVEGGAVFTNDANLLKKMVYYRNFGHSAPEEFADVGINGKNSEFHAAMGLIVLKHFDEIQTRRKKQFEFYAQKQEGLNVTNQILQKQTDYNYSYYPMVFESEETLLKQMATLNANWIYPRRYFYPSLNNLVYVRSEEMPVSESISKRILCLPLYHDLKEEEQMMVIRLLKRVQNN